MKTVIPTTAAELEDMLGDRDKIQTMLADEPAAFTEVIQAYARECAKKDKDLTAQIAEQVQATLADFMRENPDALIRPNITPDDAQPRNRGQFHNAKALGAQLDGQFEGTGDLLRALYGEKNGIRTDVERLAKLRNDFSSTVPSEGGFLIPEEFRAEMLRLSLETAVVRPRARVIPMAAPRIKFPAVDMSSNAGALYGGMVGYWGDEGEEMVKSAAKFGSITLDANDLYVYTEVPNNLLTDSAISVSAFIDQSAPEAITWFEDIAFLNGSGVGQPLGVLNAGNEALVTVAKETSQAADTIVWENIVKMFSRMLPSAISRAAWLANIDTFPELATMALSVGTGGSAVWLNNGTEGPPMTILGRPVIFTEKAGSLGDLGDLNFVDLSYYLIGDRQQMTAMTSEHFKFNTNTTAYRIIERIDGRPWIKKAVTPAKGPNKLSPFVQLGAR